MKTIALFVSALVAANVCLGSDPVPYVAHEWGTFTSVQGADGVQMPWNPLRVSELPRFVYDVNRPGVRGLRPVASKTALFARQRLETPVIYFHSAEPLTISVEVGFPKGRMTEWFPEGKRPGNPKPDQPALSWPRVSIVPLGHPDAQSMAKLLPQEQTGSHYYAARGAEADFIKVTASSGKEETEKFLFYRGVGHFDAPLFVTVPDGATGELRLENKGAQPIRDLFILRVGEGLMSIDRLERLSANETANVAMGSPLAFPAGRQQLIVQLEESLTRAGLTPSEASAMVKTWDDSWFAERGVRVLYVLSREWADDVLPLTLKPMPQDLVRVFVGRAEVITPAMEQALAEEIDRGLSDESGDQRRAASAIRALGLGRFLEPAFRLISQKRPHDRLLSSRGWELLQSASATEPRITAR